jgi:hypothetical protein
MSDDDDVLSYDADEDWEVTGDPSWGQGEVDKKSRDIVDQWADSEPFSAPPSRHASRPNTASTQASQRTNQRYGARTTNDGGNSVELRANRPGLKDPNAILASDKLERLKTNAYRRAHHVPEMPTSDSASQKSSASSRRPNIRDARPQYQHGSPTISDAGLVQPSTVRPSVHNALPTPAPAIPRGATSIHSYQSSTQPPITPGGADQLNAKYHVYRADSLSDKPVQPTATHPQLQSTDPAQPTTTYPQVQQQSTGLQSQTHALSSGRHMPLSRAPTKTPHTTAPSESDSSR